MHVFCAILEGCAEWLHEAESVMQEPVRDWSSYAAFRPRETPETTLATTKFGFLREQRGTKPDEPS